MKNKIKIIAVLCVVIIIFGAFASCKNRPDIPFISTKPAETLPPPDVVTITFPEGYTIMQIAELLEQNNVCKKTEFLERCNKPVEGIEINNPNDRVFLLEGYVFPDTYEFYRNSTADEALQKFIDNFNVKFTDEMKKRAEELNYTVDEILTLASIIQKECDEEPAECANVSSVFHNRLNNSRDAYLGSDVTYFYLKNMADYLGGADSEKFDALLMNYYTYTNYRKGLPVGAICNPGIKAISAALYPADTDYLYFLTDKTCKNFYYAETFEEHQANGKKAGIM